VSRSYLLIANYYDSTPRT